MSEAKFTPGPWRTSNNPRHIMSTEESLKKGGVIADIARVFGNFESEEADANAKLIAASPAMYEALQDIITHHEAINGYHKRPISESKTIALARAAIEKATE